VASTLEKDWLHQQLQLAERSVPVILTDDARATLMHSRAAVVASGTATVEAALAGTPFVVVYRVAPLTWLLGRRLVNLNTFAMPNLILGKEKHAVPELIQRDFTPGNVVRELQAIIPDGAPRTQMLADLKAVGEKLRDSGYAEAPAVRAAREILSLLQ
jgi:lipid-A-disaccharide synthase